MKVVIDASVTIKWFFPENNEEEDADKAIQVFEAIQDFRLSPVQPVHWSAEVISVLTRIQAKKTQQSIQLLNALEFPVSDNLEIYQLASNIANELSHHMFDTLYHAVAIIENAVLITADLNYYRKAKKLENIFLLSEYQI